MEVHVDQTGTSSPLWSVPVDSITVTEKCACGAEVSANGRKEDTAWMEEQIEKWRSRHRRECALMRGRTQK